MKYSTLAALLATTSAVSISTSAVHNPHLTATYVLNDAVKMIDDMATKGRAAESETNTHYVVELDRRLKDLNTERAHVLTGEDQANVLINGATVNPHAPVATSAPA
jgi:hypothetical protein